MMSRLVLVGVVAALGITIPTWPEIQGCMRSIHAWTAARLADLDASSPRVDDWIGFPPPPVRTRRAFTPIVPDEQVSRVADELNRAAEGLDLPAVARMARHRTEGDVERRPMRQRVCRESAVVPTADMWEWRLVTESLEAVPQTDGVVLPVESPVASHRSKPVMLPIACVFTPSASGATSRSVVASPVGSDAGPASHRKTRTELIEPLEDVTADVAGALNRFAEGLAISPRRTINLTAAKPAFEPIDPAAILPTSLADELNRASEGLSLAPMTLGAGDSRRPTSARPAPLVPPATSTTRRPSLPGTRPEVAQAMRMTRDAVHAWMRVIAGPALVQVSAR